jgi:hypothetical protein
MHNTGGEAGGDREVTSINGNVADLKEGSEEVAGCDSGYAKKCSAASSMFKCVKQASMNGKMKKGSDVQ